MTFTPGSKLNEDDLTQEDIDEYNKRREEEYNDANNPKDPNTLEEELKKQNQPDPSQGVAAPDYSLDAILYSKFMPKVTSTLMQVGGFLKTLGNKSGVLQLQDDDAPGGLLSPETYGTDSNYLTRIFGGLSPAGVEYLKTLMMR